MTATEMGSNQVHCCVSLGEAHLRAGHPEEAHALATRALELASEHQERGHQAYALRLLGEITARVEPPESEHPKPTISTRSSWPTSSACVHWRLTPISGSAHCLVRWDAV